MHCGARIRLEHVIPSEERDLLFPSTKKDAAPALAPVAPASRRFFLRFQALGFLLVAELTLVLWLRGLTFAEYFRSRDPIPGTVYLVMLAVFALMLLLVAREIP
jgi:hypothetical protein